MHTFFSLSVQGKHWLALLLLTILSLTMVTVGYYSLQQISEIQEQKIQTGQSLALLSVMQNEYRLLFSSEINTTIQSNIFLNAFKQYDSTADLVESLSLNNTASNEAISAVIQQQEAQFAELSAKEKKINDKFITIFMIIAAFIIGVGIIATLYIPRAILQAITTVNDSAQRIRQGNPHIRLEIKSKDELGKLEQAFNGLASDLQKYHQTILSSEKKHKTMLERQVRARTRDLNRKVADLSRSRQATLDVMAKLKTAHKHLQELDTAKTEFLNLVSHELKTPLTPIRANLDLLLAQDLGAINDQQRTAFHAISRNVDRLLELIANLLEISRLEAGKMILNISKLNINEVVRLALADIGSAAAEKGLDLKLSLGKIPAVNGDKEKIKECIFNYLSNAV